MKNLGGSIQAEYVSEKPVGSAFRGLFMRERFAEASSQKVLDFLNTERIGKNFSWMDGFPAVHEPEAEYAVKKRRKNVPGAPTGCGKTSRSG